MKQLKSVHAFVGFGVIFASYIIISLIVMSLIPQTPVNQFFTSLALEICVFLTPVIIFCRFKGIELRSTFGLKLPGALTLLISFLAILSGIFIILNINALLSPLFHGYEDSFERMERDILALGEYSVFAMFTLIAVVPAVSEEFLFRGFIMRGFINSYGKTKAVILTALLFGIMHLILPKIVITALIGLLLGVLFVLTDSLLIPILGHFINNVLVLLSLMHKNAVGIDEKSSTINFPFLMIAIIIFTNCIFWLVKRRPK